MTEKDISGYCEGEIITKEHEETPGGDGIFIVFIVMMVSWELTFVKTLLNCTL